MDSVQEPITPSHLLTGRRVMSLPDGPYNNELIEDINTRIADITKRMVHLNKVLEHFLRRWKKEYLLELRESHCWAKHPPKESQCGLIAVGDVVLVHEDNRPRGFWKLAKVENLIKGTDGAMRGATVRVHSSDKRSTLLRCPLQLLYPLEVHQCCDTMTDHMSNSSSSPPEVKQSDDTEADTNNSAGGNQSTPNQVPNHRSRHITAKNARDHPNSNWELLTIWTWTGTALNYVVFIAVISGLFTDCNP